MARQEQRARQEEQRALREGPEAQRVRYEARWARHGARWAQLAQTDEKYNSSKKQIYEEEKNELEKIKIIKQNEVDELFRDGKITMEEYGRRVSAIHDKYMEMYLTILDIMTKKRIENKKTYNEETRLNRLFSPHHSPSPISPRPSSRLPPRPKHDGGMVTSKHPLASRHFSRK